MSSGALINPVRGKSVFRGVLVLYASVFLGKSARVLPVIRVGGGGGRERENEC